MVVDSLFALKLAKELEKLRFVLCLDSFSVVLDIDH
jgi:hypothetical protein